MNIAGAAGEHFVLVLLSVGFAALFGLPAAVWAFRNPAPGNYLLRFADIVQTIPSLALFGLLLPWLGVGPRMAVFALFAYALLPILRNTVAGLARRPSRRRWAPAGSACFSIAGSPPTSRTSYWRAPSRPR
jgi:ABC-type proline/glycine betaine transport system permease subunit